MKNVFQIIKQAYLSLASTDDTTYPQGQATYNEKTTDFVRVSPYGLDSNPPKDSWVLLLSSQGQEAVKFGLISDFLRRKKNLLEGEVVLHNPVTGSFIKLSASGDIEVDTSGNLTATVAGNLTSTVGGNLLSTVTGITTVTSTGAIALTSAGTITLTGSSVIINGKPFLTHTHSGVSVGAANTGGVV